MVQVTESVELIRSEGMRFEEYLATLSPDAWGRPSACKGWTVADVIGHMVFIYGDICLGSVTRGLRGDVKPPEGFPEPGSLDHTKRNEFLSDIAIRRRHELGEELLPTFKSLIGQVCEVLGTLTPDNWDALCYKPVGLAPAQSFLWTLINETAMHHWDVRSALESSSHFSDESLQIIMERTGRLLSFWPGSKLGKPKRYRFEVIGEVPIKSDIVVEGDTARMEPAGEISADVIFKCDTEIFVLLMYGRLTCETAIAAGRLVGEGSREVVAEFNRWFNRV